jgi:Transposase zinc-ribbon domain
MSKSMFNAPHFQSPEAAREYLEALRWGSDRVCPHCGTVNSRASIAAAPSSAARTSA